MIPRLKPFFDFKEIKALFSYSQDIKEKFEEKFAKKVGADYALSFSYGRSGLFSIFRALDIHGAEVIIPAYTCVVVANAIILSENIPKFVDVKKDFNLNLKQAKDIITKKTKVIIPTNMFGYPVNLDLLTPLKNKLLIIQDCALAFNTKYNKKFVSNESDFTLYSLTWSKHLSTVRGGVITTNNKSLYKRLKKFRDKFFKESSLTSKVEILLFAIFNNLIFNKRFFSLVRSLERKKLLDWYVKYYSDEKIFFPNNYNELFSNMQAKIGLEQLKKSSEILEKRIFLARRYNKKLEEIDDKVILPPIVRGATYSHYCIRLKKRDLFIKKMEEKGINVGCMFDYSIPYLKAYSHYRKKIFSHSLQISKEIINLPLYPSLTLKEQDYIIDKTIETVNEIF